MKRKCIVIQSISDLVTNSSSEVFLLEGNDAAKEFFNKDFKYFGGSFYHFDTIEDVKKYLEDGYHSGEWMEAINIVKYIGTEWECLLEYLKEYKTFDEIFEFFKFRFEGLVGKTVVIMDNNYSSDLLRNMRMFEKSTGKEFKIIEDEMY